MGKNAKRKAYLAALADLENNQEQQRQNVATVTEKRKAEFDKVKETLPIPKSALMFALKRRHHARSGMIQYGNEYATFGATETPMRKGLVSLATDLGGFDIMRYRETDPNNADRHVWFYVLSQPNNATIKLDIAGLLLRKRITNYRWHKHYCGYVITETDFRKLQGN